MGKSDKHDEISLKRIFRFIIGLGIFWLLISTILPSFFGLKFVGKEWNLLKSKKTSELANKIEDIQETYSEKIEESYKDYEEKRRTDDLKKELCGRWEVIEPDGFSGDILEFKEHENSESIRSRVYRVGDVFDEYSYKGELIMKTLLVSSESKDEFIGLIRNNDDQWLYCKLALYNGRIDIYMSEDSYAYKHVRKFYLQKTSDGIEESDFSL
jgi:hypothetical protein